MSTHCLDYFNADEDVIEKVRRSFGVDEEEARKDVEILRGWMKKQPHLPGDDSDELLEGFLLRNKYNLETTKRKIECYYTMRGLNKDYFKNIDPLSTSMQNNKNCFTWVPTAKLTPKLERVFIFRHFGDDSLYDFGSMMLYILCVQDLRMATDPCTGDRLILDFGALTMTRLTTVEIGVCSKTYHLYQQAFSGRIRGIEFLNAPPFIGLLLTLMKAVMSKKIYEKITLHEDLKSLHKSTPKDCLPKEYGGSLESIEEMHEKFWKVLLEEKDTILRNAKRVSDESQRIGDVVENYQFGVEGSFKKLNLD